MTIVGQARRCTQLVLLGWMVAFFVGASVRPSGADGSAIPVSPDELIQFDIPAQSLDAALRAYSVVTGLEVFYNAALVDRRSSRVVAGAFTRAVALQRLLDGTGYVPQVTADGTVTIGPEQVTGRSVSDVVAQRRRYEGYLAAVQARISAALCAAPDRAPSDEDILLRLWLAADGAISRAEVLDKAAQQGARIVALLGRTNVGLPPVGMPQPVILAVFPPSPMSRECRFSADEPVGRDRTGPALEMAR
ncbi:STN domain-containing protein [Tardiphaga sp. 172_B4_N1_3]|uniref:STN domain-containing protein n=1 Tax=Tardiphaga sp. 172_B4_N1_3 TaxID=3240787 RepID=UPI003F8C6EE3